MKKFRDWALFMLIILSVSIIIIGVTYNYNMSPVSKNNNEKVFIIKKEQTVDNIVKALKEDNLIRNPKVFKLYLNMWQIKHFKEGEYKLKESMSSDEIAKVLSSE